MHRVHVGADLSGLHEALRRLPAGLRRLVDDVDVVAGVDPLFIGLHGDEFMEGSKRSLRDTTHIYHAWCAPDGHATIVAGRDYEPLPVWVWMHELGHYLHERLDWPDVAQPAENGLGGDPFEAFASSLSIRYAPERPHLDPACIEIALADEAMRECLHRAARPPFELRIPPEAERRRAWWNGQRVTGR